MAVELATGYISLVPSAKGIAAGIEKEMGAPLAAAARTSGAKASGSFAGSFKSGLAGVGKAALGIVGVTAGVATGLVAIGNKFDQSFDKIALGTGATGKQLEGLDKSFKTVLKSGANSMDAVSSAVTTLFQRTGLTGQALEDFANKEATLARITGTDLNANLQSTTGLFNLYGIAAAKQASQLDVLFKASQVAGVSITQLTTDMQAAAPTAKILGLSFGQTAALVANLDKAGLPASKVMLGLAGAFAKAAKAGKSPLDVIHDLTAEVKRAPNATVAATIAVQKFGIGARQAATLVAGLRSGAIDLNASLAGGKGILAAAAATDDFSEKFANLKNAVIVGLEPIATKAFDAITKAIVAATPFIGRFVDWFGVALPNAFKRLQPLFRTVSLGVSAFGAAFSGEGITSDGFVGALERIGVAVRGVVDFIAKNWKPALAGAVAALTPFARAAVPLGEAIARLAVAAGKFAVGAAPLFLAAFKGLAPVVGGTLLGSMKALTVVVGVLAEHMNILGPALIAVGGAFAAFKVVKAVETGILGVAKAAGTAFGTMQRWQANLVGFGKTLSNTASSLKSGVSSIAQWGRAALVSAFNTVKQTAAFVAQKVASLAAAAAQKVLTAAQWLLNAAMSANPIVLVVAAIAALVAGVILAYQHFKPFHDAVDAAWQILQTLFHWVQDNWPLLIKILTGPIGIAVFFIVGHFQQLKGFVTGVIDFVRSHWPLLLAILTGPFGIAVLLIKRHFDSIVGFFAGLPGRILAFAGTIGLAALSIGKAIIDGIKSGITSAEGFVGDIASAFVDAIKAGWNTVAKEINDFLPNSIGKGPFSINLPDNPIPTFASGGIFDPPGGGIFDPPGGAGLAILHPGEGVFTPDQMKAMGHVDARTIVQGNVYGDSHLRKIFVEHDDKLALTLAAG